MAAVIMDGKALAKKIKDQLKVEIAGFTTQPRLTIVANEENDASAVYVRNKQKDCEEVGIACRVCYPDVEDIYDCVFGMKYSDMVNGVICQMPVKNGVDEKELLSCIDKEKDVDGFVSDKFDPCTPAGIMELLKEYNINITGKHCVVVGRSDIVGKPMAKMLLDADGTVTVCHSKTKNLAEITRQADILVAAVGRSKMITADMVKDGAVVIDVGINRDENGKLCGDVDFASVAKKASHITPVPGGVGPMTRAMLLVNTVKAYKNQNTKGV